MKSDLEKLAISEEKQMLNEFEGSLDFCFFSSMEKKDEKKATKRKPAPFDNKNASRSGRKGPQRCAEKTQVSLFYH